MIRSLWVYNRSNRPNKLDFHGAFIPQISDQLIEWLTEEGDTVLDLFSGSNTSMDSCKRLKRLGIGIDLNPREHDTFLVIQGDSSSVEVNRLMRNHSYYPFKLIIAHPPYLDIIKFSDKGNDMSNMAYHLFYNKWQNIVENAYDLLEDMGFFAVIIGDVYNTSKNPSELEPLGFKCMEIVNRVKGLTLKSINIKNIAGNEHSKGPGAALTAHRINKVGATVFEHEYIIVWRKQ